MSGIIFSGNLKKILDIPLEPCHCGGTMKLEQAIELVLNEAESSALGESSSEGEKVLEAVELARHFFKQYGYHFNEFTINQE